MSKWNVRRLTLSGKANQLQRYNAFMLESIATKIRESRNATHKDVQQSISITDANGANLREHGCLSCKP